MDARHRESLQRPDRMLRHVTARAFYAAGCSGRWRKLIDVAVRIHDLSRSSDIFQTLAPLLLI